MNCTQARALLAVYRELQEDLPDIGELDEHLERCAECRQALAEFELVSARLQQLPAIEPPPEMREKLMRALAVEHSRFLQHAVPGTPPPPAFLKPYLQEHIEQVAERDPLATFSTAETGPLPVIQMPHRPGRRTQMPHLAALAVAATFLLALLTGGLTSLLLLAQNTPGPIAPPAAINHPTNVVMLRYITQTSYTNVVSAVADGNLIYYTAFNNATPTTWMLLRMDRQTRQSEPLLASPVESPLIVLGSSHNRLVWLQFDAPAATAHRGNRSERDTTTEGARTWSLHYLALDGQSTASSARLLLNGTYNPALTPDVVHTPVPGIWFSNNELLIAAIDQNGISHLWRYDLESDSNGAHFTRSEIARASAGHVYTSPTATSDGAHIFWADEWLTADGSIQSNIWTEQPIPVPSPGRGLWLPHTAPQIWLFRADGTSFRPLVVDQTFFMLNTNDGLDGTSALATPTPTPIATPSSSTQPVTPTQTPLNPGVTPWADPSIYQSALDFSISGSLYMLSLDSSSDHTFSQLNTVSHVSALQGGSNFVLWQEDNGTYGMFDVESKSFVQVGSVLNGAQFVSVNGNSAVWSNSSISTSSTSTPAPATSTPFATLGMFNWPPVTSNAHP